MSKLFDAEITFTFPAEDIDEADAKLEDALDFLYDEGFEVQENSTTLEESIKADE